MGSCRDASAGHGGERHLRRLGALRSGEPGLDQRAARPGGRARGPRGRPGRRRRRRPSGCRPPGRAARPPGGRLVGQLRPPAQRPRPRPATPRRPASEPRVGGRSSWARGDRDGGRRARPARPREPVADAAPRRATGQPDEHQRRGEPGRGQGAVRRRRCSRARSRTRCARSNGAGGRSSARVALVAEPGLEVEIGEGHVSTPRETMGGAAGSAPRTVRSRARPADGLALDGVDRAAERLRGGRLAEVLGVAEDEDGAHPRRQRGQRLGHALPLGERLGVVRAGGVVRGKGDDLLCRRGAAASWRRWSPGPGGRRGRGRLRRSATSGGRP